MDLIRPLGMAGVHCAVIAAPKSLPTYSRFVRTTIPWNDEEISEGAELLVDLLIRFGSGQKAKPVLFYEQDAQLLFVSRNREKLSQAFRFIIAKPELVEDLVDKGRFQVLAERLNLPVPQTQRVQPGIDTTPKNIDVRFPVVVKPLWRRTSWRASGEMAKVIQINSREALHDVWPRWSEQGDDLLLQELIPGPETQIESYHVYCNEQGNIVGEFTGRKIRTLPTSHGHSTALTITDAADVIALGRSLVEKLHLRGVAKFDFKRDQFGMLHLLEVNPRFNLWHHLGAVAGVNLPALVFADLTGLFNPKVQPVRTGACWCRFSEDWHSAKDSGMAFKTWLHWALRCEATSLVWDDPLPFAYALWQVLVNRLPIHQTKTMAGM
jgi:D-aspartate ligase